MHLWGHNERRPWLSARVPLTVRLILKEKRKETICIPWIHTPIHVFICEVFSKHLMCVRNCSRCRGHCRETAGCFREASILVRRDRRYIGCQRVIRLMERNAAESGLGMA